MEISAPERDRADNCRGTPADETVPADATVRADETAAGDETSSADATARAEEVAAGGSADQILRKGWQAAPA